MVKHAAGFYFLLDSLHNQFSYHTKDRGSKNRTIALRREILAAKLDPLYFSSQMLRL